MDDNNADFERDNTKFVGRCNSAQGAGADIRV